MTSIDEDVVVPRAEFYATFSAGQVAEIVDALRTRAEFPFEFTYLGRGAEIWSAPARSPEAAALVHDFTTLLGRYAGEVVAELPADRPIRVVDLGCGTGEPVRGLLDHLLAQGRFAGYRAVDLSAELLDLAGRNLRAAFPAAAARIELRRADFTGPELAGLLAVEPGEARCVVLAGATANNFADLDTFLRRVSAALTPSDLLVMTLRVATDTNRPSFYDRVEAGRPLAAQQRRGLDLLNIDPEWYETERGFDRDREEIFVRVRFLHHVTLRLDAAAPPLSLAPGDTLRLWRYRFLDRAAVGDLLARAGFAVRLSTTGDRREAALLAAVVHR